jgi:phage terminase large subunit-like protein
LLTWRQSVGKSLAKLAIESVGADGFLNAVPVEDHQRLQYEWGVWARPEQLPPEGDWTFWLLLAGRGFGKTKTGAEWVRAVAEKHPGCLIALIARTAADVRTTMLEGPSGLLSVSPPWFMPHHEASKCKLTWPNGSVALHFSAEEPKGLRGPQFNFAWCDELAAWPTRADEDGEPGIPGAWSQLQYGLRMPHAKPRVLITTTPRPVRIVRELINDQQSVVVRGSTFDNEDNLAPDFVARMRLKHSSTRFGRQELYAEILDDVPGALWTRDILDRTRVQSAPELRRVVVAVDPSGGHSEDNDEQGIVVAGLGIDAHGYTLADRTCRLSPDGWGRRVIEAYQEFKADRIVFEANYGGEMCEHVIRTAAKAVGVKVATKAVKATRGKVVRAEPVAALFEQGRAHHVGNFDALEDEQCQFTPLGYDGSPNRIDAEVWAYTDLMLDAERAQMFDIGPMPVRRL